MSNHFVCLFGKLFDGVIISGYSYLQRIDGTMSALIFFKISSRSFWQSFFSFFIVTYWLIIVVIIFEFTLFLALFFLGMWWVVTIIRILWGRWWRRGTRWAARWGHSGFGFRAIFWMRVVVSVVLNFNSFRSGAWFCCACFFVLDFFGISVFFGFVVGWFGMTFGEVSFLVVLFRWCAFGLFFGTCRRKLLRTKNCFGLE